MLLQLLNLFGIMTWSKMLAAGDVTTPKLKRFQEISGVFTQFKRAQSPCETVFSIGPNTQLTLRDMLRTQSSGSLPAYSALLDILTATSNPNGYQSVLESFLSVQPSLMSAGLINRTEGNKMLWWNADRTIIDGILTSVAKAVKNVVDTHSSAAKWWKSIVGHPESSKINSPTLHLQKFCSGTDQKLVVLLTQSSLGWVMAKCQPAYHFGYHFLLAFVGERPFMQLSVWIKLTWISVITAASQLSRGHTHVISIKLRWKEASIIHRNLAASLIANIINLLRICILVSPLQCVFTSGYGFKEGGYQCCCSWAPERCYNASIRPECSRPPVSHEEHLGTVLMVVNLVCIVFCLVLILVVINQRKVKVIRS